MARAADLTRGTNPHPNPRVGCLVVSQDGAVVGSGAHLGPGQPHAEVLALRQAGSAAQGGTVYVTLEPCAHLGRTPPCTAALVAAGVGRVIVGTSDPDPLVTGRGFEALRSAGIEVDVMPKNEQWERVDPGYFHQRRTGRPRVTLKLATTLDGQIAAADGTSQWITGDEARHDAHLLRARADAVMVGAGTVLEDDPRLSVRVDGYEGPQPVPIVVAGRRALPPGANLFRRPAIVISTVPLPDLPAEVIEVGGDASGRVDLGEALQALGVRGILDVLVEGGAGLAASLLAAGMVERGVIWMGGLLAGGLGRPAFDGVFATLAQARRIRFTDVRTLGGDVRIEFELVRG